MIDDRTMAVSGVTGTALVDIKTNQMIYLKPRPGHFLDKYASYSCRHEIIWYKSNYAVHISYDNIQFRKLMDTLWQSSKFDSLETARSSLIEIFFYFLPENPCSLFRLDLDSIISSYERKAPEDYMITIDEGVNAYTAIHDRAFYFKKVNDLHKLHCNGKTLAYSIPNRPKTANIAIFMTANDRHLVSAITYTEKHIHPSSAKIQKHYTLLDHAGKHINTLKLIKDTPHTDDHRLTHNSQSLWTGTLKSIHIATFTLVVGMADRSSIDIMMIAYGRLYPILNGYSDAGDQLYRPPSMSNAGVMARMSLFVGSLISLPRRPSDYGGVGMALAVADHKQAVCFVLHAGSIQCVTVKF